MKKLISFALLVLFILSLSGCDFVNGSSSVISSVDNTSLESSSSNLNSTPTESNQSSVGVEPSASDSQSSVNSNATSSNQTASKPQNSDKPIVSEPSEGITDSCQHNYKSNTVQHTCNENGYTEFVCDLCGHSYKKDIVEAKHTFIEYICSECGMGDKQYVNGALSFWIKKNGEKTNVALYEEYSYIVTEKPKEEALLSEKENIEIISEVQESDGVYTASSIWSSKEITFKYQSSDGKEVMEITLFDSENCSVNYINNDKMAAFEIKSKAEVLSNNSSVWNELQADEEFKIIMKNKTEAVLKFFEENFLVSSLGFTITDLGFIKTV